MTYCIDHWPSTRISGNCKRRLTFDTASKALEAANDLGSGDGQMFIMDARGIEVTLRRLHQLAVRER